ncbi:LacI family DNA-binding transcriptional regulator [Crystallibacter degradans]|uniref:LacI family DNA-binding transcriptional regulator n=1 Tax=Crystallibacter degradans TaxID=2726743 RepID=UPI001472D506|nr:LacI family DNA-binding transcriptional regulator [Arthrobacter sp. SF27]NMR29077.1 LacI family transcriptional regulator [Arthrobacter sp. SF27]
MSAVTLSEVAKQAGVSLATASRVLNGSERRPAEVIAERVRTAALELGYVANAQAQALARSSTGLVGLVVHDIADPYFSSIARGVQQAVQEVRRQLLLAAAETGDSSVLSAVTAFAAHRTDVIIMAGSRSVRPDERLMNELKRYRDNGGRVVTIGQAWMEGTGTVFVNNRAGAEELLRVLAGTGQNRFAYLAGPDHLVTVEDRLAGFRDGLERTGAEEVAVVHGPFNRDGGYQAARALAEQLGGGGLRGLTVLAANDVMALGAISAFRSMGLQVPRDLRVAGYDDIPTLSDYTPSLTTVRLPLEEIGHLAADLAFSEMANATRNISGAVVLRESA